MQNYRIFAISVFP